MKNFQLIVFNLEQIFAFLSFLIVYCHGQDLESTRYFIHNWTKHIIPDYYIKEVRPPTLPGTPLVVEFSMKVIDINAINIENMDFNMDMYVKQQWTDIRIRIPEELFDDDDDSITLPSQYFDGLWQPDLYFLNSKVVEIATLTHKFSSVTLFKNKTLQYTARMHAKIACRMEFYHYPMDTQECAVSVESFSYNNQKMVLKWADPGVIINPELNLLQYTILEPLALMETDDFTIEKNGNYSRLAVILKFKRHIGHHLIQTFAPSALVVVISWFSFWLELDAIPGRVTLLVTCLLTLVTLFTDLRSASDIPAVAYVKALDLWLVGCVIAVFAAMGEFVIVKVFHVKYMEVKQREAEKINVDSTWTIDTKSSRSSQQFVDIEKAGKKGSVYVYWKTQDGKTKILWKEIDKMSRIIFPAMFFTFTVLFWSALIAESRYLHET